MPLTQSQNRRAPYLLAALVFFAFLARLAIAMSYQNNFDTAWYLQWADGLQNGFFDAYADSRAAEMNLDYPPLWLYPLYLIGALMKVPVIESYWPYRMLLIKFFPILFDCLIIILIYLFASKKLQSAQKGLIVAGLWAANPSSIYNCAFWGQTDSVLIFFLLLCLWFFDEDMPVAGSIVYAVGALTKLQFLYFAPVIFLLLLRYVIREKRPSIMLKGIGAGLATVLLVFLPFMIGSRQPLLIFKIYFGGVGRYPQINLNAANLYGLFPSLNWVDDEASLFGGRMNSEGLMTGGFSFWTFSFLLLVLSVILVAYYVLKSRKIPAFSGALLMIQLVFMLTTRQHERYQMGVIGLSLMLYVQSELDNRYLLLYGGLTTTTFFNQFLLLAKINNGEAPWVGAFGTLLAIVSFINVLFFVLSLALLFRQRGTTFGEPDREQTSLS